jgi:hypothetical protein
MENTMSLWRPFLDDAEKPFVETDILLPILPFSLMNEPTVILLEKAIAKLFPPSDVLSALVASGLLSSVNALIEQMSLGMEKYSSLFHKVSGTFWQQRGIYLSNPSFKDDTRYEKVFFGFLEAGFLIPPERTMPLILPVKPDALSEGELSKLSTLLIEAGK